MERRFLLGHSTPLRGRGPLVPLTVPAHHFTTHCFLTGATGSGKTAAALGIVEEALRQHIPVLMIDIKGDLPNLGLCFPSFSPKHFEGWVQKTPGDRRSVEEIAEALAAERASELGKSGLVEEDVRALAHGVDLRVITPGSEVGEPLHLLSSLERPTGDWHTDPADARASLSAAVSLILRLLKRNPDAATSRDHVLLSLLAERRMRAGMPSDLASLIRDVLDPPVEHIGALTVNEYAPARSRADLAAALNTLLASPAFESWRTGTSLDVGKWLTPTPSTADGSTKTPAVIVSVAHLDDDERALVLGVVLEELLTWVRGQGGSKALRALVLFDELHGFLPPHPKNPPTKAPLVALIKQARAFGVGMVLATQNPMDLDYRVLGNTGIWYIGRLQTDADRARVIDGLSRSVGTGALSPKALEHVVGRLKNRWFVMRDVRSKEGAVLVQPRWVMSYLRGPMAGAEMKRLENSVARTT